MLRPAVNCACCNGSGDRQRALQFGDNRSLVDAGPYDDLVHGHDASQPLEFTMRCSLEARDPLTDKRDSADGLEFSASVVADAMHPCAARKLAAQSSDGSSSSQHPWEGCRRGLEQTEMKIDRKKRTCLLDVFFYGRITPHLVAARKGRNESRTLKTE